MRWDVYTKEKEELIKREFLVSVTHPERGGIVWTCVKGGFIKEKEGYEAIGIRGFGYKSFKDEECGRGLRGIIRVPLFEVYY